MHLSEDLKEFIELLKENQVDFVVVGAHALAYHGIPRYTGDIDILLKVSEENAQKVIKTIIDFGFSGLDISVEDFLKHDSVVQFGIEPNRIDLLNSISGVSNEEIWNNKVEGELDGLPVFMIGKNEFIQNKLASGRPKDRRDVDALNEL